MEGWVDHNSTDLDLMTVTVIVAKGMVSINRHLLSGTHFLYQYSEVFNWQILNLGLNLICLMWHITADLKWPVMPPPLNYIVIIIIIICIW